MTPYYQRGSVTLYLGDAREVTPRLSERGVVIFDPPYSEHTHSKSRRGATFPQGNGKPCYGREVEFGFAHLSPEMRRHLARETARLAARWSLVFSDVESAWLWRIALSALGMEYVRTCFWEKIGGTPQFTGDRPAIACETITVAHPKGRKRWNGGGKRGIYSETTVAARGGVGASGEMRVHTTQKPETLMLALCNDFTEPGELIYDFTAGSCTTGIGALRANGGPRRFVGIEREERWIEAGARRLDAELSGSTYSAAQAGQRPLFGGAS